VGNFAQTIPRLHLQFVRLGQDARRFDGPAKWRSVNRDYVFSAEPNGQPSRLFTAFVGKLHVSRAGETIFGGENSGAMPNEKNASVHLAEPLRERMLILNIEAWNFSGCSPRRGPSSPQDESVRHADRGESGLELASWSF
jgi:hypothetical protein